MTSCCQQHRMPWSGATGAIARCKRVSTGCGRKSRSGRVWRWICGVKRKPKAVNKPLQHFIVHELDKPGSSATVSKKLGGFFTAEQCLLGVLISTKIGFDHGAGHPLLLLCNAKASNYSKNKAFNDLAHYSEWPKVAGAVIKA